MDIKRVDYSIRTRDLESSRRFYTEVIGLKEGPRPPFDFPGYWLYSGEPPADLHNSARNYGLVHLMGRDDANPGSLDEYVGERKVSAEGGTGPLDHVAFAATGYGAMLERCTRSRVKFHERDVRSWAWGRCSSGSRRRDDRANYPASGWRSPRWRRPPGASR
jgi:catechol 2,3-dioxygenase-like lactoylglutathione lyase family enzyme